MDGWGWIFPKRCVGCRKWGRYICEECGIGLVEEEQICPGCGRVSRYGLRHSYCKNKGDLVGVTGWWEYGGLVKRLIEEVKYSGYFDCLGELWERSLELAGREEFGYLRRFLARSPVVVPVPLYGKRERERGFNQAEKIGQLAVASWQLSLQSLLVRVKDTGQQVGKDREERRANIKGAFKIAWKGQMPKYALVVDDVWTTGATMQACAKELLANGVEVVWGLVLAR